MDPNTPQITSASVRVRGRLIIPPVERFWKKVNKDGPVPAHCPELGPCWVWTGAYSAMRNLRYGKLNVGGSIVTAHRFSWNIHHGETRDCVLHKCDNPLCVNPGHLFHGSKLDNMRDMIAKGRARHNSNLKGEQHYGHKLTEAQVVQIKQIIRSGDVSLADIARRFGVSSPVIGSIKRGRIWKHLSQQQATL